MKRNGFTLIELLGVIIILSLLVILVFPSITNSVKNSSKKTDDLTKEMIYKAADLYVSNHKDSFKKSNGNKYTIDLEELVKEEYLSSPIKFSDEKDITSDKCIQVIYDKGFSYELKDIGHCQEYVWVEEPDLYNGTLTAVKYNGENWIVVDPKKEEWYNYANQEWANAVILNKTKNVGDIVSVEGTNPDARAMFVWIPRYEYNYKNLRDRYAYGTRAQPGEIHINFIPKEQINPSDEDNYKVHPAFKFGNTNLGGIWVGKFETSHNVLSINDPVTSSNRNKLGCSSVTCTNATGLRILPNTIPLRHNTLSNFFYASRSFLSANPLVDSHMMKNVDWGAVAYLSQSRYGKYGNSKYGVLNKEIYLNNAYYKTGKSSGETNPQCYESNANGTPKKNSNISYTVECESLQKLPTYNYDDQNRGVGASTTGNIYGVYDMNGGAAEMVMGFYGKLLDVDSKYYDVCNAGTSCDGQAMRETSGWHNSELIIPTASSPIIRRGGKYDNETDDKYDYKESSIYSAARGDDNATFGRTFRIVLTNP